jgi:bacterioferritin-associated ferredoxin
MYVCLCKGITDSDIRDAMNQGASDFSEVRSALGVGTVCGNCASLGREVVQSLQSETAASQSPLDDGLFYSA